MYTFSITVDKIPKKDFNSIPINNGRLNAFRNNVINKLTDLPYYDDFQLSENWR